LRWYHQVASNDTWKPLTIVLAFGPGLHCKDNPDFSTLAVKTTLQLQWYNMPPNQKFQQPLLIDAFSGGSGFPGEVVVSIYMKQATHNSFISNHASFLFIGMDSVEMDGTVSSVHRQHLPSGSATPQPELANSVGAHRSLHETKPLYSWYISLFTYPPLHPSKYL